VLCTGGGVLFSTVLIHMLKEVRESMEKATELGMLPMEADYPFAELILCMGRDEKDTNKNLILDSFKDFFSFCW
jgi:hypothetical protein